jgi:hypothetical protein
MEAIVVAAIGPLLTAGLAALGFVLRRRLHEHDLKTRHERAVARATAQITALEHLLRVYEAAAEPAEREPVRRQVLAGLDQARADLEHAYAALRGAGGVTAPRVGTTDLPAVRRLVEAVLMLHLRPATWRHGSWASSITSRSRGSSCGSPRPCSSASPSPSWTTRLCRS